jgi:hypothetical protein
MSDNTEVDNKPTETNVNGRELDGTYAKGHPPSSPGRPRKGDALTDIMREYLDGCVDNKDGITRRKRGEIIVQAIYQAALKGNSAAQKLIWEHLDGKPMQKIQVSGQEIKIEVAPEEVERE